MIEKIDLKIDDYNKDEGSEALNHIRTLEEKINEIIEFLNKKKTMKTTIRILCQRRKINK